MSGLLWLLVFLLTTRMVYLIRDSALGPGPGIVLLLIQLAGLVLLYAFGMAMLLAAVVIVLAAAVSFLVERRGLDLARGWRLASLGILLVGLGYADVAGGHLTFSSAIQAIGSGIAGYLPLFSIPDGAGPVQLVHVLLGLLLLANETNIVIRAVFHYLGLDPATATGQASASDRYAIRIDEREYRAGRIIGILERWLMFLVLLSTPNLAALAFIIAAKGLARMKQLEKPPFAEYLLVGTLLSAFFSIVIARWMLLLASGDMSAAG